MTRKQWLGSLVNNKSKLRKKYFWAPNETSTLHWIFFSSAYAACVEEKTILHSLRWREVISPRSLQKFPFSTFAMDVLTSNISSLLPFADRYNTQIQRPRRCSEWKINLSTRRTFLSCCSLFLFYIFFGNGWDSKWPKGEEGISP